MRNPILQLIFHQRYNVRKWGYIQVHLKTCIYICCSSSLLLFSILSFSLLPYLVPFFLILFLPLFSHFHNLFHFKNFIRKYTEWQILCQKILQPILADFRDFEPFHDILFYFVESVRINISPKSIVMIRVALSFRNNLSYLQSTT